MVRPGLLPLDKITHLITKLGTFEPEFRLVLVTFYAVFGSMGFFGWGYVSRRYSLPRKERL